MSCPVIVIPPGVREISHIIFAYDGTSSAIFAIRQFSYLFPELSSYKLVIVNASDREDAQIMLPAQLKGWLEAHYTSFVFEELHGKRLEILLDYLAARKNAIVVMGSYGRSRIPRLIRESSTGILIRQLSLPFFVAHL